MTWRLRRSWRAAPLLRRVARAVASAEGFRTGQLSIAVVGARAMSTLHQTYLNIPGPTDVLTFDLGTDRRHGVLDAEIIICADVAAAAAARRMPRPASGQPRKRPGASFALARRELALYVAHGLLHLSGYDDHTARQFKRMHAREDELLSRLGHGSVFAGR